MTRDAATLRQMQAAAPFRSTWLSANAGSGKTRVLTNRVARLLLCDVPPQRILCLTYTKAAASEMQNRLFGELGKWAMLDDAPLAQALADLGHEAAPDETTLRRARRLFARAIETPGGLKIQTIHSFCAALLRRFPLEAGVSPQFVEMDDRAARRLRAEIVEDLADGSRRGAFDAMAAHYMGDDLDGLTEEIVRHRTQFPDTPDATALARLLGLSETLTEETLLAQVFTGGESALFGTLLPALRAGSATDIRAADRLSPLDVTAPTPETLKALEAVFLSGAKTKTPFSAKVGRFPTRATRAKLETGAQALDDLMQRVADARPLRLGLAARERTLALHRFAAAFLPEYDRRKQAHGWLDFDDLILRARALLTDPGVAAWVLFRLDGGIDHILVDEAQDTAPEQWKVIEQLAQEFTAGAGARDETRTVFVVGDKKQSIYSFQGADPDGFDRMREAFAQRLEGGTPLQDLTLEYSFRSAPAILNLVDTTFPEGARAGLGRDVTHRAFKTDLPGRVDLWPVIEPADETEPPHWADPVDTLSPEHHAVQLARRMAGEIRAMIDRKETVLDGAVRRPVSEGDFLILVQRRSDLFHEIIRACKSAGLAIAGADRLKLGGEIAVRDLHATLAFLATPEDDLSLATALRSPLFGWGEGAVYDLAAGREGRHLWQTLRRRGGPEVEILTALRDSSDFLRPYELLERILTRHRGRQNLIARLGPEAEDGIDALLAQALAYERMEVPSLTGFLSWLDSGDVEIKRQLDSAGDRIRVMTVHGAKGLEAPIVILPDTADRPLRPRNEILPAGLPLWRTPADDSPPAIAQAAQAWRQRQEEERARLLYVAMTRAEQWLIVAAAGRLNKDGQDWYQTVRAGMERGGATVHDFPFGAGLRLENGCWGGRHAAPFRSRGPDALPALPDWATTPAPRPARPHTPLSPSGLGGAKGLSAQQPDDTGEPLAWGSWVHLLLEHLPRIAPDARRMAGQTLLAGAGAPEPAHAGILAEAEAVLEAPDLAGIFTPDSLAEVEVTAPFPGSGAVMLGAVDRLIVQPDRILAVDYKTNAVVAAGPEDVPEGILRQMGAYAAALRQIYPDRPVETAILWTRTRTLMSLPDSLITQALARVQLDGTEKAPYLPASTTQGEPDADPCRNR
ncbi:DNA helicase/exodeoxyribonuclease V subunit A [Rhodovulum imhoffii]|uniref:DNA 3'-5' helicase n=1 Tax=Rhodovulum imhoffii TaxID=365340 RepID=A0A2T5BRM2_9RHOB|nr:double-strand break repair helicase AddA [Rhodovulum imhoffii]MBK5934048.1 double-strand break repair helicase AddA [Rhodovulum imhoffii]PTN01933.1 DNA helicase/exodeoxyribonuclease V subunit A [Rhodovulum imhoffii]